MAKCKVIRGGWTWHGVQRQPGDIVVASAGQIWAWARDGYVEPIPEPKPQPKVETAESAPPPENAAKRTTKPPARRKRAPRKKAD